MSSRIPLSTVFSVIDSLRVIGLSDESLLSHNIPQLLMWEEWKDGKTWVFIQNIYFCLSEKYTVHHVYSVLKIIELLAES